jgi:alkylation response protein AidB-like acyl-CoA dehydrogenase
VDVPKHKGISYFVIDVRQPGVEIRPIREMTGRALFCEVFLSDARVPATNLIGGEGNGWSVANTTLRYERGGGGAIGGSGSSVPAGPIAGNLNRPAGDCVKEQHEERAFPPPTRAGELIELARALGQTDSTVVRQSLVGLYIEERLLELTAFRLRGLAKRGEQLGGLPQLMKMGLNHLVRRARDVVFDVLGPTGMLFGYDQAAVADVESITGFPALGRLVETAMFASAVTIYGGSDQIQHNVLGERGLGLPREPGDDRAIPFRELLKN